MIGNQKFKRKYPQLLVISSFYSIQLKEVSFEKSNKGKCVALFCLLKKEKNLILHYISQETRL